MFRFKQLSTPRNPGLPRPTGRIRSHRKPGSFFSIPTIASLPGKSARPLRAAAGTVSSATFEDRGEQVRLAVGGWGKWLWIGLLAVGLFAGRFRRAVSHLLLAVAVSLTVADLVSPVYSLSTVFSNDVVYVDALMIAISCAAIVAVSPVFRSLLQSRVLPRRFSVRWQASSAAVLVALAAMGWYGQVIGSVLVTGAIAYLAFTAFLGPSPLPPNSSLSADPKAPEPGML